jgi:peptidoglycan hydrolase FlgJ
MDPVSPLPAAMPQPLPPTPRPVPVDVAKTARDFEAVFLGQMTKLMMESTGSQGEFTGGHGEEMFRGILAEELGKSIAQRGGLGLAPAVQAQIIHMQGGSAHGR